MGILEPWRQVEIHANLSAWSMALEKAAVEHLTPHMLMKPRLSKDGNQWCALFGENLQEGCAGFGDTPEQAMIQFDVNWKNERAFIGKEGTKEALSLGHEETK